MKDKWFNAREELPKLPDAPFCNIFVLACNEGDTKCRPMLYQRSQFHGKTVEKWLTANGGETYRTPDYWQYLPKPPKHNKGSDPSGKRC